MGTSSTQPALLTSTRPARALAVVLVLGGCREVGAFLRAPHGASAQQQQQAMAEMAFAARLRESFHDNSMSITTAWPESSYTVVFQDSGIVELPESARASLARRVAEFIRDHYDGYAAVRRVNVRFATSRFTFPVQVVQGSQR